MPYKEIRHTSAFLERLILGHNPKPFRQSVQMQCIFCEYFLMKEDSLYCSMKHINQHLFHLLLLILSVLPCRNLYSLSASIHLINFRHHLQNRMYCIVKSWICSRDYKGDVSILSLARYATHAVFLKGFCCCFLFD